MCQVSVYVINTGLCHCHVKSLLMTADLDYGNSLLFLNGLTIYVIQQTIMIINLIKCVFLTIILLLSYANNVFSFSILVQIKYNFNNPTHRFDVLHTNYFFFFFLKSDHSLKYK